MTRFTPPERFNLADWLLDARVREGLGDKTALRTAEGDFTYLQVQERAHLWGRALLALGIDMEDRVLLALRDGLDFVAALFGTLEIGAVAVMANPDLPGEQVEALAEYVRPRVAVVDAEVVPGFAAATDGARWPRRIVAAGPGEAAGLPRVEDLAAGGEPLEPAPTHRDDAAIWLFSGGTTGRPKAVVQTHRAFANTTVLYGQGVLGLGPGDVTLSVPKLYFGYATGSNLFFPFSVGATVCLFPEHPTPEVVFARIAEHRPTLLINVPTMIQKMVAHPAAGEQDLSSLRLVTSAGEALPPALYARWREAFGSELLDGLGTAEMWHVFLTNRPGKVRPGTLGTVVDGFEISVRDEVGAPVTDGEVGRLWVRGDSRAVGYWQDMPRTMETFRGEWVALGDLVSRDGDGFVTYCGRADDVLKVGGKWCAPAEVEACLLEHPAVAECAVVGVENAAGLLKPVAFVVADDRPGLEDELKSWSLERLAAHKHPRRVFRLEAFPRTHLGKVDRGRLKAMCRPGDLA